MVLRIIMAVSMVIEKNFKPGFIIEFAHKGFAKRVGGRSESRQ